MRLLYGAVLLAVWAFAGVLAVKPSPQIDFTEVEDLNDNRGFVSVYKNYPKIQVTVDTSKLKRVSQPESEDSSSGSSGSSGSESVERPSVGVRTDITIEISEEAINETNTVDGRVDLGKKNNNGNGSKKGKGKANQDDEEEDSEDGDNASVPVFKGMAGVPTKPTKTPRPSTTGRPEITLNGDKPKDVPPFIYKTDERRHGGGNYDGWNRFHPSIAGFWTTERPYYRRIDYDHKGTPIYVPYHVSQHHPDPPPPSGGGSSNSGINWQKTCYCNVYPSSGHSYHHGSQQEPTPPSVPHNPWDRAPSNPVLPTPYSKRKNVDNKVDLPYKQHHD
ncbi:uncharacterized protein LOC129747884 [Uranotaenia lowii]|uniref:uncharacterized protein LOC129747884 n=1 Tax=Uranotaenia lowii TaxID=190385 RepID=UPI002479DCB9|nr:uncharacterized protein LOC129747884 [Uranotaenia lowii]